MKLLSDCINSRQMQSTKCRTMCVLWLCLWVEGGLILIQPLGLKSVLIAVIWGTSKRNNKITGEQAEGRKGYRKWKDLTRKKINWLCLTDGEVTKASLALSSLTVASQCLVLCLLSWVCLHSPLFPIMAINTGRNMDWPLTVIDPQKMPFAATLGNRGH